MKIIKVTASFKEMEGKDSLHYRVSIKPNTGFLKGLIKLTNF